MSYLFAISIVTCLLETFLSFIVQHVTSWIYSETKSDQKLRSDIITIKQEMNSISMVDEFSRYAKLQRKYFKVRDDLKDNVANRKQSRLKTRVLIKTMFRILNVIFVAILLYYCKKEPIVVFPKGMFSPLDRILSWPSSVENCISLPVWLFLVRLAASTISIKGTS